MTIPLLAIGLISILGQIVLLRELNVAFFGVELIYILALGTWLFWSAVGAVIARKHRLSSSYPIAVLLLVFGLVLLLDIVFIRFSRTLLGDLPGAYLSFSKQSLILATSLSLPGLLSGILFQWAARLYVETGRTLAIAYAMESAGGLVGGIFATLFMMGEIRNFSAAILCSFFAVAAAYSILQRRRIFSSSLLLFALATVLSVLLWKAAALDQQMTRWNHPHLLESIDSPYGRITLSKIFNQLSVFENDALAFETEGIDAEWFCHLAALQHPRPQKVLILGGGIEGTIREIMKYHPQRIDYVELNPFMLRTVMKYLPAEDQKPFAEKNVHIIFADPRNYLKKGDPYDLILVGMPEPSSGQNNRFYTREFFELCAAGLHGQGIVAFRLRSSENLWTKPLTSRNASIYKALKDVFPEVLFLPGSTSVVTASHKPLPASPDTMSARLEKMHIHTRLVSSPYLRYLFTNDRFLQTQKLLEQQKVPTNTDVRPICYSYTFTIWLSKFFPHLSVTTWPDFIEEPSVGAFWSMIIAGITFFSLIRFVPALRRITLVVAVGFIGMVLETVLILYYQTKHGVLYRDIGWLLMSFMTGLALGSPAVKKRCYAAQGKNKKREYGVEP